VNPVLTRERGRILAERRRAPPEAVVRSQPRSAAAASSRSKVRKSRSQVPDVRAWPSLAPKRAAGYAQPPPRPVSSCGRRTRSFRSLRPACGAACGLPLRAQQERAKPPWGAQIRSRCKPKTLQRRLNFCTPRAPARVLARKAQNELSQPAIDWRTARTSPRLRPLATHELSMPAQKRLRGHDQSVATPSRKQSGERRKQSTIVKGVKTPIPASNRGLAP